MHANYVVHSDASNGVGDVARSGVPPPQHSRACDFLNDRSVSSFDSFSDLVGYGLSKGVPSYIPKKRSVIDAVCIDHVIGSSNVLCRPSSIAQCSELGHVQAADDHILIAGSLQFPLIDSTATIPRKKTRYDRPALGDAVKSHNFIIFV